MTHIRSGRKVNNDQIAVAIDIEKDDNLFDDEDDDKCMFNFNIFFYDDISYFIRSCY